MSTIEDVETVTDIEQIPDLMDRVRAGARLAGKVSAELAAVRHNRNMAALIAHLDHGVAPIVLYRDVLGMSRGMFKRYLDKAPSAADRKAAIAAAPEKYGDAETAMATAKAGAAEVHEVKARLDAVLAVRDDAALMLMEGRTPDGGRVPPVPNRDIVEAAGLTSARVAQLRRGVR